MAITRKVARTAWSVFGFMSTAIAEKASAVLHLPLANCLFGSNFPGCQFSRPFIASLPLRQSTLMDDNERQRSADGPTCHGLTPSCVSSAHPEWCQINLLLLRSLAKRLRQLACQHYPGELQLSLHDSGAFCESAGTLDTTVIRSEPNIDVLFSIRLQDVHSQSKL